MSHLSKLTLSEKSPNDGVSPVERKRRKLIEQLDQQIEAATLVLDNKPAMREVQRWIRPEGATDKQLVSKLVPIRKWWWLNTTGQIMLSLRQGNKVMEIARQDCHRGRLAKGPAGSAADRPSGGRSW